MDFDIVDETKSSAFFDETIGHIQDIILSEFFEHLQDKFFEEYWQCFDYEEENKLEYMDVYIKYQELFEQHIQEQLQQRMPHFQMESFAAEMEKYVKDNDFDTCEIYELMQSFTNFSVFKELMLDYRRKKEGHMDHLGADILVTVPCRTESTMPFC